MARKKTPPKTPPMAKPAIYRDAKGRFISKATYDAQIKKATKTHGKKAVESAQKLIKQAGRKAFKKFVPVPKNKRTKQDLQDIPQKFRRYVGKRITPEFSPEAREKIIQKTLRKNEKIRKDALKNPKAKIIFTESSRGGRKVVSENIRSKVDIILWDYMNDRPADERSKVVAPCVVKMALVGRYKGIWKKSGFNELVPPDFMWDNAKTPITEKFKKEVWKRINKRSKVKRDFTKDMFIISE